MTSAENQAPVAIPQGRRLLDILQAFDAEREGAEAYALIEGLYPICRSITGDGLRQSQQLLREIIPVELHEVLSGTTQVFNWTVPKEWNIRDSKRKCSFGDCGEGSSDFSRFSVDKIDLLKLGIEGAELELFSRGSDA
jgi:aminopeptidase-like protein